MHSSIFSRAAVSGLLVVSVFAVCLQFAGCGRKAAPKPPESTAPGEVGFPAAGGSASGVVLTWLPPVSDGSAQITLKSFRVYRGIFTKGATTSFKLIHTIELEPETGVPASFTYSDTDVQPGVTYDYAIEPVNGEGTGGKVAQILRVSFRGTSSAIEVVAPPPDTSID